MVRLLHASVELNTWAGALNMFALWAVSAGVAALILAVFSGNARQALTGGD